MFWSLLIGHISKFRHLVVLFNLSLFFVVAGPLVEAADLDSCDAQQDFLAPLGESESGSDFFKRTQELRTRCQKPWLILIDMDADSNLFGNSVWDLHEMEASVRTRAGLLIESNLRKKGQMVGSGPVVDVVVQWHLPGGKRIKRLHLWEMKDVAHKADWTAADFERAGEGFVRSPIIQEIEANPQYRFSDFLDWGRDHFPSQNQMLIFWGHNEGWSGKRFNEIQRSLQLSDREKVEIIAIDGCNAASLETAFEFATSANYFFAPSGVQTALGLPYRRLLKEIHSISLAGFGEPGDRRSLTPDRVARALPRIQGASLSGRSLPKRFDPLAAKYFSSSSWDLKEVRGSVVPEWNRLSIALRSFLESETIFRLAWDSSLFVKGRLYSGNDSILRWLISLRGELNGLESEWADRDGLDELISQIERLQGALLRARVGFAQSANVPEASLGFWLPSGVTDWRARREDLSQAEFMQSNTDWFAFLDLIYQ